MTQYFFRQAIVLAVFAVIAVNGMWMPLNVQAQSAEVPVFVSGTEGYKAFRIPAILRLPEGSLLAFAEGRLNGPGDWGNIDIVMKRSTDGGKTWSPLQVVVDDDTLQVCNPAPVLDKTDPAYPGGRLFLFYNTGNVPERQIYQGLGVKLSYYTTSSDGGKTWSAPVNITSQIDKLNKPELDPAWNHPEDWRYYANTPGHAIQLEGTPYRGRILVAANHTERPSLPHGGSGFSHTYYTDDHGRTFHLGNSIGMSGSNESTAVELPGGGVLLNARSAVHYRIVAFSKDGGITWDTTYVDYQLPDPGCEGSIVSARMRRGKPVIAFCNEAAHKRDSLTLRISFDEGSTWTKRLLVDRNPASGRNYSAYSDIAAIDGKRVGILYEKENYTKIVFKTVKW
jgi:sialidase-1